MPLCQLQVTNEYLVEYLCFNLMDRQSQWSVQWHKLVGTIRPVSNIIPHTVPFLPFEAGSPSHQFWPPKAPGRKAKAPRGGVVPEDPAENEDAAAGWDTVAEPDDDLDADQGIDEAMDGDECGAPPVEEELLERATAQYILRAEEQARGSSLGQQPDPAATAPSDLEAQEPGHSVPAPAPESGHPESLQPAVDQPPVEAEPPAPAAPQHMGHRAMGQRTMPAASVDLLGGRISYHYSKQAFEATCCNPAHGQCVLTRTCHGRSVKGHGICGGRPVGFLGTWLAHHDVESKKAHWNKAAMQYPHAERLATRRQIQGTAAGRALLSFEREKASGEDSEPETLKTLVV